MRTSCSVSTALWLLSLATAVAAQSPASIPDRARGADRVVVAQVTDLTASYETNEYGDRLIVSHVGLSVEQTLKGTPAGALSLDVPGGTIAGLTLDVSHEPKMNRGDRAVVFLTTNKAGKYVPYHGQEGVLKLDSQNRVKGTSVDLDALKQMIADRSAR